MKPLEIKGARTRLGYKQQFMADSFGISLPSYRNKESGIRRFTDAEKAKVGEILELTPCQLNDFLYDGILPIAKAGTD